MCKAAFLSLQSLSQNARSEEGNQSEDVYNNYFNVQIETEELYTEAGESHYPVCFIDVDRKLVSMSGTYFTQRARKELIHMYSISQIIKEAEESVSSTDDIPVRRPPVV